MEQTDLRRRLLVARAWGGFENREQLAAAIDEDGLGEGVIGQIERGERPARPRDMKAIAEACGVPPALLLDESYDPFKPTVDLEAGSESNAGLMAVMRVVVLGLEEMLEEKNEKGATTAHSAALEELRQLDLSGPLATDQSDGVQP